MILVALPLGKWVLRLGVAAVIVLLFGAPILGILEQPWAPFWLGQQANAPLTIATPAPGVPGAPIVVPTPGPALTLITDRLLAEAMSWLGVRYLWSGCTRNGIDCSCFMQNIFRTVGVSLPRTTTQQILFATPISAAQARLGDLVFFDNTCSDCGANPTHVGLVISSGTAGAPGMMVDAGDPVRVESIYGGHNARFGRVLR